MEAKGVKTAAQGVAAKTKEPAAPAAPVAPTTSVGASPGAVAGGVVQAGDRIVIERLEDGNWAASYLGRGQLTVPDARRIGRAVEQMQRDNLRDARLANAAARTATMEAVEKQGKTAEAKSLTGAEQ